MRAARATRVAALLALALALTASPHDGRAQSGADADARVMSLGVIIPRNPQTRRAIARWNQALAERTEGRVSVRVYWGGAMGDDRTMVRRMRIGQLDASSLTSTGLSIIYRPVLVLQVPGVFTTYEQVDRVRESVGPELAEGVQNAGFTLLGWGDAGRIRIFSRDPVRRPRDLRSMRPWVSRSDTIFTEVLSVIGANGVALSVGEVFGGLRTGMIDVVPASSIAVGALQWFTSLRYVTAQSDGFLVGGMVVREGFLETLRPEDRVALLETARENQSRFVTGIRQSDERAYQGLISRAGLTAVDNEAHRAEWADVGAQARRRLAGRVFPPTLLQRVERIAAGR